MDHITVKCSKCSGELRPLFGSAYTLVCQKCGSEYGSISYGLENKYIGVIEFRCSGCKKNFVLQKEKRTSLACPYCGNRVVIPLKDVVFSKVVKGEEEEIPDPKEAVIYNLPEKFFASSYVPNRKENLRIVIPYYYGGPLVEKAAKTWIIPETVFALTDEGVIPPGSGICHQFFTEKNAKSEKLHSKKTKPFLIDLLRRLTQIFPDEEYYGFFNSDIILPPGLPVSFLLPGKNKVAVFHHRLDLIGGESDTGFSQLPKGNQVCVGKDGFIACKKVIEKIIAEVPDMVIGAPTWDDGLLLWCWKEFGVENVELRYGDIWHVSHVQEWKLEDKDSVFNQEQLESVGVSNRMRYSVKWHDIEKKTSFDDSKRRSLGIIQPGRIGDIIIVLPIAKWFYDRGYRVIWPVCPEFLPLFNYVNYVEPIDLECNLSGSYGKSIEILRGKRVDTILDLGIGFGRDEEDWIASGLRFNEWKYGEAGIPFEERFNFQINRNYVKEDALWNYVKEKYKLDGGGFSIIHDEGTKGSYRFSEEGVRIQVINGFTVFDWIGVIEKASYLYCADSCFANLADILKLCEGRRSVWFWKDIPDRDPKRRRPLGFPKLCDDWKVLQ